MFTSSLTIPPHPTPPIPPSPPLTLPRLRISSESTRQRQWRWWRALRVRGTPRGKEGDRARSHDGFDVNFGVDLTPLWREGVSRARSNVRRGSEGEAEAARRLVQKEEHTLTSLSLSPRPLRVISLLSPVSMGSSFSPVPCATAASQNFSTSPLSPHLSVNSFQNPSHSLSPTCEPRPSAMLRESADARFRRRIMLSSKARDWRRRDLKAERFEQRVGVTVVRCVGAEEEDDVWERM